MKPVILFENNYTQEDLQRLKNDNKIWTVHDILKIQVEELFEVQNPEKRLSPDFQNLQNSFVAEYLKDNPDLKGNWVYFPWNGILLHTVNKDQYHQLFTNRNKNLVTKDEQDYLYNKCIAFAGLSVGSHFATGLAHCGIAGTMKFADFDVVSTTNLNRMNNSIKDIGIKKIDLLAQHVYEINPYQKLVLYENGLDDSILDDFTNDNPKPDLIFEMIDDFKMKIKLRLQARKAKIPLIMLTHLADSLLVDIERYDLQPDLQPFNGLLSELPEQILNSEITEETKVKYAIEIVGRQYLPERLYNSLKDINKSLVGRPQLYSSVAIGRGFASFLARQIFLGTFRESGRFCIPFEKFLK